MGTPGVLDLHFKVIAGVLCVAGSIEKGGYDGGNFEGPWMKDVRPDLDHDEAYSSLVGGKFTPDIDAFIVHMRERAVLQARQRDAGLL